MLLTTREEILDVMNTEFQANNVPNTFSNQIAHLSMLRREVLLDGELMIVGKQKFLRAVTFEIEMIKFKMNFLPV